MTKGDSVTSAESGVPLQEQSSASFKQLLDAAGLSANYLTADGEVSFQQVADALADHKRLKEDKASGLLKAPDQYSFDLPDGIKQPDGLSWNAGKDDPDFIAEITGIAKNAGLDQATVSSLVGAYAKHSIRKHEAGRAQQQKAQEAQAAELAKLGPKAGETAKANKQALDAHYGEGAGEDLYRGGNARASEILNDLIANKIGAGRSAAGRGNGQGKNQNDEDAALVGTRGGASRLLRRDSERARQ